MSEIPQPKHTVYDGTLLDITQPAKVVEVNWSDDKSTLWVNVDGQCRLRICKIPHLDVLMDLTL